MLPKDSPQDQARRSETIQSATIGAARVPLEVARKSVEVMELAVQVVDHGNANAISDGAAGAAMARAALTAAGYNVRINLMSVKDRSTAGAMLSDLGELERRADKVEKHIHATLSQRGGISLE
jgi:formiminotetrahydrofolate cyclodeaminase